MTNFIVSDYSPFIHGFVVSSVNTFLIIFNLKNGLLEVPKIKKYSKKRKIEVQLDKFSSKLELIVGVVKEGTGTTNDRNTARKFSENPSFIAEITGLNESLIRQFSVILQTIDSGKPINITKFDE